MSKRIKITILQVPQVGDIVRFTMPTTAPKSQTFVTFRSDSKQATIGTTAVQSAANLYAAYVADFGGITEMKFSYAPGTNYIYLDNTFTAGQINTRLYNLYSSNTANIEIRTIGMESYPAKITAATLGDDFAFRDKMGFGIPVKEFFSSAKEQYHQVDAPEKKKKEIDFKIQ